MEDYERSGIVVAVFSYLSSNRSDALSPNIYIHCTRRQPAESLESMLDLARPCVQATHLHRDLIEVPAPYNAGSITLCQNAYVHGGYL